MVIDVGSLLRGEVKKIDIDYMLAPEALWGIEFESDAHVTGTLTDNAGYMRLVLKAQLKYHGECARCLAPVDGVFSLDFERTVTTEGMLSDEQLEEEFHGCLELAKYILDTVGMLENCTFRFSQWDPARAGIKYEGTPAQWEHAQSVMKDILDKLDVKYEIGIDEAAFYGPKLDIQYKNVFGKEDTIVTIQIDLLLAKKFGMEYTDSDNTQKTPYIIHRTSIGCYERTLALLLEKYAGALPLWLSPTQVTVLPVSNLFDEYGEKVYRALSDAGLRVDLDNRNEKLGYRMREAQLEKVPYMVTVGFNEQEQGTVSIRSRRDGDLGVMSLDDFIARLKSEIETKKK